MQYQTPDAATAQRRRTPGALCVKPNRHPLDPERPVKGATPAGCGSPNGDGRVEQLTVIEDRARAEGRG
jgi:hypothetical protein